jgi:hypothetical protein
LTRNFFLRGDEQEASGYKDLTPEIAGPASSDLQFDSFDKIPRRRRPVLAMAGLMSLLAIGAVSWRIQRGHPRPGPARMVMSVAVAALPASRPISIPVTAAPAPVAADRRSAVEPIAENREAPAPKRKSESRAKTSRPIALHGFVWSAAANALVPVEGADVESQPSMGAVPEPSVAPPGDDGIGSAAISPTHFQPAAAPAETGAIEDQNR